MNQESSLRIGDIVTASGKQNHVLLSRSLRCFPGITDVFKVYRNSHLRCIGDAAAMTYCFCIPRDMNHPISDNFNNNTFYVIFTHTNTHFLKYLSLLTSHLVTDFLLYGNTHLRWIADAMPMHRRQLTTIWKPALSTNINQFIKQSFSNSIHLHLAIHLAIQFIFI